MSEAEQIIEHQNDPEAKLMARIREGDTHAFEELYQQFRHPIANFFYHLVRDHNLTENLLQETFIRVWKAAEIYRPTGKFSTYIFQIAKNLWLNEAKKKQREPNTFSMDTRGAGDDEQGFKFEASDSRQDPANIMLKNELRSQISTAIDSLGLEHRVVFVLSEYQGLKYREISEILEIPVGTVKSRMANAEKYLRQKLAKYVEE